MNTFEAVSKTIVRSMEEKIVCKLMGKCRVANTAIVRCRPELVEGLQGLWLVFDWPALQPFPETSSG